MYSPAEPATLPSWASFPPELLDYLVNFISSPSDLLSLALTNSALRAIVIPFHLHYRIVRCFVNDSAMWNHLLENRRRVQNVQALELYPSTLNSNVVFRRHCLPPILRTDTVLPPDSPLALSAIKHMTHLKSLSWNTQKFHQQFLQPGFGDFAEKCWDTVSQHCSEIQEVVARSLPGCCDCAAQRGDPQTPSKLFNLRGLTSLSYTFSCTESAHTCNADPLCNFLASNPELQELRLLIPGFQNQAVNLQQLFQHQFPSLRTFSLVGRVETVPVRLLIDFFAANPLLESVRLRPTFPIAMSPTPSYTHLLPALKDISARSAALVGGFLGNLPDGTVRPLKSISVSLQFDGDLENIFNGTSRAAGEGLQALSITFEIPETTTNWAKFISNISSTFPNLRRLDVNELQENMGISQIEKPSHPNPNNQSDYWFAPLRALWNLELLNVPNGFFECLVIRPKTVDEKLRFNQDAMLELIRICPSLRLINGPRVPKGGFIRRNGTLIYLRPAGGPAEQIDLTKPRYNNEGRTTVIELLGEGRSTDFTWQLYSVVGPAGEEVWKTFLPSCDNLRFAC